MCHSVLKARRERDEQECAERLLTRRMLQIWQQLKVERRQQGFAATRAKLQVQTSEHGAGDQEENDAELEEEVEERRLLHKLSNDGQAFDEAAVREETASRQQSLRRAPGEKTLVPVYTEEEKPTDIGDVPVEERRRQLDAGRVMLYAVLLVDGRVVGQSETVYLHPFDFCARFQSATSQLQLLQAPSALSLQLWQRRYAGFADMMISEVFLAVPEVASPAAPRWQHYSFASDRPFKGGNVAAPAAAPREVVREGEIAVHPIRCLCGIINVSVAWASQPAASRGSAVGTRPSYTALTARGDDALNSGALDTARVRQHTRAEDLDPNAPHDVPLLALISRSARDSRGGGFRAFRFRRELQLIKDWIFSDRLQLLQLRRERPHEWQLLPEGARAVPPRDAEIPPRMRELLQGGAEALTIDDEADDSSQMSKIRAWVKGVLARQQRAKSGKQFVLTTKDVVKEPLLEVEVPPFDLNALLEKTFSPRRQLLPQPKTRKPEAGSAEVARRVEVVIIEGVDLPVRTGVDAARTRPFVEVSFQGQVVRTEVKAGASPIWNQRLSFELVVPGNDWSQQALANLSADVSFNLFDRMERSERDVRETNGTLPVPHASMSARAHADAPTRIPSAAVLTLREEQRWLGSFTLPFSTLYRVGEVKGVFPLAMPAILLGYTKDARSMSKRLVPHSALQLFITVDPLLPPLKSEVRERFSAKDVKMQEFAASWIKSVRGGLPAASKDRQLTVFAPTSTGDRALVCCFVRPQPPPPTAQLANDGRSLLRFVSLIPYLDDAALGLSLDVWNTTASFLDLCAGDAEEHALLLCNLFLSLGKHAYVALGTQLPEGDTAYVLTREGGDIKLWDASRGKVYSRDSTSYPLSACPLSSVGCVFNENNVWANIQAVDRPADMDWVLNNAKCWRPFFDDPREPKGNFPQPRSLQSVQAETLEYRRTTDEYRSNLEAMVEQKLQGYFEELRGHRPTDWNRSFGSTLKKLLKRLEEEASKGTEMTQAEVDAQIQQVQKTFSLQGFPIHTSMVAPDNMQKLLQKLRNTNLWMVDRPKIQFALTAYVHAYPNSVTSVWVYAAALTDNRA